ncbi:hypothetical protein ACFVZL_35670, partial [Streptomyces sp. NPDC058320]
MNGPSTADTTATSTSTTATTAIGDPWEELVTVALLGTDRRTPPGHSPGADAPIALLDAAAVQTVRRRGGAGPRPAPRPRRRAPGVGARRGGARGPARE